MRSIETEEASGALVTVEQGETAQEERRAERRLTPRRAGDGERVVRDSFTMPADDYRLIAVIRERCLKRGVSASKSEVLRAGLVALDAMKDKGLAKAIQRLPKVKTGRPATSR